jgi:hypothetical protein
MVAAVPVSSRHGVLCGAKADGVYAHRTGTKMISKRLLEPLRPSTFPFRLLPCFLQNTPTLPTGLLDRRGHKGHLAPLRAFIEGTQQLEERLAGDLEDRLPADLLDLCQGGHCVGHHHGIAVCQQVLQCIIISYCFVLTYFFFLANPLFMACNAQSLVSLIVL